MLYFLLDPYQTAELFAPIKPGQKRASWKFLMDWTRVEVSGDRYNDFLVRRPLRKNLKGIAGVPASA
jgi:hypothetical protein